MRNTTEEKISNKETGKEVTKRRRILNIRPLFIFLISVMFGIFFMYSLQNAIWAGASNAGIIISSCYLLFLILIGGISFSLNCNRKYKTRFVNFIKCFSKYRVAIIGGIVFFLIGVGGFSLSFTKYNNLPQFESELVDVVARVSDNGTEAGSTTAYELKNITINNAGEEYELNSNGRLYIYGEYFLKIGDVITFSAEISSVDIKDGYNRFVNKQVYTFYNAANITVTGNKLYFDESVRNKIFNLLSDNMNRQNAALAYSILFGYKSEINTEIRNAFSYSGIAHLLAVSGMNTVFLVVIFAFLLKKLKANKYINFLIITLILILYCYLCGFTPSVVRAALMSIILLFTALVGIEYDILSALSLSGLLILIINPFDMLSVGFQLSFASVFGIITLSPPISKFLTKSRCPKWLRDGLAITVSANIAVVLISLNYFNQFALLGILTNLIVLPVFSIAYSLLFVISFLGIPFKFIGALLVFPDIILHFIKLTATWISSIPHSLITVFKVGFISILILMAAMYIVHFLMINKRLKRAVVGLMITVITATLLIINIPVKFGKDEIYLTYQSSTNYALFVNKNNERILVGVGNQDDTYLDSFLMSLKVNKLDALVIYEVTLRDVDYINQLVERYGIKEVLFASSNVDTNEILTGEILCGNVGFISQSDSTEVCGYSLYAYYYNGKATGVVVTDGDTDTLLLKNRATRNALTNVANWWNDTFENVVVNKSSVADMDKVLSVDHIYSYGYSAIESAAKIDIRYKRTFTLTL